MWEWSGLLVCKDTVRIHVCVHRVYTKTSFGRSQSVFAQNTVCPEKSAFKNLRYPVSHNRYNEQIGGTH